MINYQGYLKQDGVVVNATKNMSFALYDALSGGAQLCTTGMQAVNVVNGIFSYKIGEAGCNLSSINWSNPVYLEVSVDGIALSPRELLTGTSYLVQHRAADVIVSPAGDVAATNVQSAVAELDAKKLSKAGGAMSGALYADVGITTAGNITAATGTITAATGTIYSLTSITTPGNIVAAGNITAATGTITAASFAGDGSALTGINASALDHNTMGNLTTGDPHTQYVKKAGDTMTGALYAVSGVITAGNITAATGTITAQAFSGDGAGLTNVGTAAIADNSVATGDVAFDFVGSLNGVVNKGGNIQFVDGGGVSIVANDAANTITLSANAGAVDHNTLSNLTVGDPHTQYFKKAGDSVSGQITSTYNAGAPFVVTSNTVNTNLNADLLDGQHAAAFMPVATDNWVNTTGDVMTGALGLAQSAATATIYAYQTGNGSMAGDFEITNAGNNFNALSGQTNGGGAGVYGYTSGAGNGVYGINISNGSAGYFYNNNNANTASALQGITAGTAATSYGVYGQAGGSGSGVVGANSTGGNGVYGSSPAGGGNGVYGSSGSSGNGVYGLNNSTGYGVYGISTGGNTGIYGSGGAAGSGVFGTNSGNGNGVEGSIAGTGYSVYGVNSNAATGKAGYFNNTNAANTAAALSGITAGTGATSYGVFGQAAGGGSSLYASNAGATGILYGGNHTGVGGNLIQLQSAGVDEFVVTKAGAVTAVSFSGDGSALTGIAAATDHNSLANLTVGDPHTQYFKKAGDSITGTMSVTANNGGSGVNLRQDGSGETLRLGRYTTAGTSAMLVGDTNQFVPFINFSQSGNPRFFVNYNGNVYATGTINTAGGIMTGALSISANSASDLVSSINSGAGKAVYGENTGTGRAGYFEINNAANISDALLAITNGSGYGVYGANAGTTTGMAGYFTNTNAANSAVALSGVTAGTGRAGAFFISNAANNSDALYSLTLGGGIAGNFMISNAGNAANALNAQTNGTGNLISGNHTGASGNLLRLQQGGVDKFVVDHNGNITTGGVTDSTKVAKTGDVMNGGLVLNSNSATATVEINNPIGIGVTAHFTNSQATATVYAENSNAAGYGVYGNNTSTGFGVYGFNASTGYGVYGKNTSNSTGKGGYFENTNAANTVAALTGTTPGTAATSVGVKGFAAGAGSGVFGGNNGAGFGVYGENTSTGPAIVGNNTSTGDLLRLQKSGVNKFVADNSGNLSVTGTVTVGSNTGANGFDVNFYGTYSAIVGSHMSWYAAKDAFRAGLDDGGAYWNNAIVGAYSMATGWDTTASGISSTALGYLTTSSGPYSFSAGQWVTAGGAANTIALGQGVSDASRLVNNTVSSFMVGFNSNIPTLFVGPSTGVGTTGKVGIGTTTPATALEVNGALGVSQGGATATVSAYQTNTTDEAGYFSVTNAGSTVNALTGINAGTGGSSVGVYGQAAGGGKGVYGVNTSNGYAVTGDATGAGGYAVNAYANNGATALRAYQSGTGYALSIENGSNSGNTAMIWQDNAANNGNVLYINKAGGTGNYISLSCGGGVNSAGAWSNCSSRDIKKDIASLGGKGREKMLDMVKSLDVVSYRLKVDDSYDNVGLIAEDAPGLLSGPKGKSLNTANMFGMLIAAVQRQQEQIETLKANNDTLKSDVDELKNEIKILKGGK